MYNNTERILIVHSVANTHATDLTNAEDAIKTFKRLDSSVRTEPLVFEIPSGAAPGATLGTELTQQLRACIGAVVFVDDLRPNVAYELGFFHGKGRIVLLLTRLPVDATWLSISDLAGAALCHIDKAPLETAIHSYLNRLYNDLSAKPPWPASQLPSESHNLLGQLTDLDSFCNSVQNGPWGPSLKINSWGGVDLPVGLNLLPSARFKIVLRAEEQTADYSIYFDVYFPDHGDIRRRVWLGLTSLRRASGLQSEERTFPSQPVTTSWHVLNGQFIDLLERGHLMFGGPPYYLDRIRFRAGRHNLQNAKPIEVGFVEIVGVDR